MKLRNIFAIIATSLGFPHVALSSEEISIIADSWCPYNCEPNSPSGEGILVELAKRAFNSDTTHVKYLVRPWNQSVADVRTGKYDAVIAAAKTDSVGLITPSKPQVISITCAYALKQSKKSIKSAHDLRNLSSIGLAKDYSYGEITDRVLKDKSMKGRIKPVAGDAPLLTNIHRVQEGKIEVVIEDSHVMEHVLNSKQITDIKSIGCTEDRSELWIAFSSKNSKSKELAEALVKTQDEMKKSGELSKIYRKYGVEGP